MSDGITDMMREEENRNKPVFHKRESGFQFSQIIIKKIGRDAFVAEFKSKFTEVRPEIYMSIYSHSVQGCIYKVGRFFDTELIPEEVTVQL